MALMTDAQLHAQATWKALESVCATRDYQHAATESVSRKEVTLCSVLSARIMPLEPRFSLFWFRPAAHPTTARGYAKQVLGALACISEVTSSPTRHRDSTSFVSNFSWIARSLPFFGNYGFRFSKRWTLPKIKQGESAAL
eukprot:4309088-Amphidinium_carterae.2